MPNWCECTLIVMDDNFNNLETFYQDNKDESQNFELSFNKMIPLPDDEQENWYNWRVQNWGTKWDLSNDTLYTVDSESKYISYSFNTAWNPPFAWLNSVTNIYKDLTFQLKYAEPGHAYAGRVTLKYDKIIEHQKYSYSYHQWIEYKEEIIESLKKYANHEGSEVINNALQNYRNIIKKISESNIFLPEVLQDRIYSFNFEMIKNNLIKKFINDNKKLFIEFLEEEFYIYDSDILDLDIIKEL